MSAHLTVEDLINILAELPPDMAVFVRGYEDGVDYVTAVDPVKVRLFANSEWYYGQHEEGPDGDCEGVQIIGEHVKNHTNETGK